MTAAVKSKLPVVTEAWLDKCIADGRRVSESGCLLKGEVREEPKAGGKRKLEEEKKIQKLIIKGKGAVHPDSGMADDAHILEVSRQMRCTCVGSDSYYRNRTSVVF